MTTGGNVARQVRRARGRERRKRQSLGDALYPIYVIVLFTTYPLAILGSQAAPGPGAARSAAAAVEPVLLLVVAVAFLIGRAAAAVRGGPVVVEPEDARMLFTWPIPRRWIVVPALLAALSRAVGGAMVVSAALLYVDVRYLGSPARAAVRDDLLLPALVAVVSVLVAWLVQATPAVAPLARAAGAALAAAGLLGVCWGARQVGALGFVPALAHIADTGPDPASLPMSGAATGSAASHGAVAAVAMSLVAVPLAMFAVRAAARATPEQMLSRSRRANVTKTGLQLGFTSSVYLSRTEPVRRSRRRRYALATTRTPAGAVAAKALLQEQGTPILPRLLTCAVVIGAIVSAAARVTPGRSLAPTVVWAVLSAIALTLVATRFADPVRLDVDAAPLAGTIPLPYQTVAAYDLLVSTAHAIVAACVGVAGASALGVLQPSHLVTAFLGGAVLATLLPAAGALGALSNDPSPLLPPAIAIGYRSSGFIAVTIGCVASALLLRAPDIPGSAPHSRLGVIAPFIALVAGVTALVTVKRAAGALRRGR